MRAGLLSTLLLLAGACSSSSSSGAGGGGGDGGVAGNCPTILSASQVPFNDAACGALGASDFSPYGATIRQQQEQYDSVCHYFLSFSKGGGAEVDVTFNPVCQYDGDHAEYYNDYQKQLAGGDGLEITAFEDEQIGEAAFWYVQAGSDELRVKYKQVELLLGSNLCTSPTTSTCSQGPDTKSTILALGSLIVGRF
jgi:hypothetical protein